MPPKLKGRKKSKKDSDLDLQEKLNKVCNEVENYKLLSLQKQILHTDLSQKLFKVEQRCLAKETELAKTKDDFKEYSVHITSYCKKMQKNLNSKKHELQTALTQARHTIKSNEKYYKHEIKTRDQEIVDLKDSVKRFEMKLHAFIFTANEIINTLLDKLVDRTNNDYEVFENMSNEFHTTYKEQLLFFHVGLPYV